MYTTSCTILQDLREATRACHQRVEQNFYTSSIMDGSITLGNYLALLQKFYGFYKPMEERILSHPEWKNHRFDIAERAKAPLLERDLVFLGIPKARIEALPFCPDLPSLDSFAAILGAMYVMEGATLGGQVLLKQLKKHLQFTENAGAGFFNSYGKSSLGIKWEEYRTLLTTYAQEVGHETRIVEAGCQTFERIEYWLNA